MPTKATEEGLELQIRMAKRVAALNASATRRSNDEAEFVSSEAALLGSDYMANYGDCASAALPSSGGRSMTDVQKWRTNFYTIDKQAAFRAARIQADRNWFARPVVARNCELFGDGFSFKGEQAKAWLVDPATDLWRYPFLRVHDDCLREWFTCSNVVALWRKDSPSGKFPAIEIPDCESVEVARVGGVDLLKVSFTKVKLPQSARARMGDKMFDAICKGATVTLAEDDEEWDFEVMTDGKSSRGLSMPSMTAIQDDLEFIEAVRVGDWNGAWRRRITILHSKKGYGVESGTNAGSVRTHAKRKHLAAISSWMKELQGHGNAATNFDQSFEHVIFPSEFFNDSIVSAALSRLLLWGGLGAVMMLKSESQISGVSPYLMLLLRAEALNFRRRFGDFLKAIFNSDSFRNGVHDAPVLIPEWSPRMLFTLKELQEQSEMLRKSGASAETIRAAAGLDHAVETARFKESEANPGSVIPLFEPNQGLSQAYYTRIYTGKPGGGASEGGAPGRPTDQT